VGEDLQKMTLDVLSTCIFGTDFDSLNGNLAGPLAAYNYVMDNVFYPLRLILPFYNNLPLPSNKMLDQKTAEFDSYCWSIISDAKASTHARIEEQQKHENEGTTSASSSLITLMIDNGMTEQEVRDNVGVFFLAGHETTASTLTWAVGLLATYPEVQEKARKEVLTKAADGLTYESLKNLEYIDWIIHETMRLYPVVPIINGRGTLQDITIGEWHVPAKTAIQIDFISMLHNPTIYESPKKFVPERWAPEKLTKEQRISWMPFSYGPRICLGMNFSIIEQKIFLSTLLREFSEIRLAKDSVLEAGTDNFLNSPNLKKLNLQFVRA